MDWLYVIGRILFGAIFIGSGINHLTQLDATTRYADAKGVGGAKGMVAVSGIVMLLGGFSVVLGFFLEVGTWLLALFLIAAAVKMHAFWNEADPGAQQNEMAHFMKNLSLAGAAIMLYWMVQTNGYGPMTLGQPL